MHLAHENVINKHLPGVFDAWRTLNLISKHRCIDKVLSYPLLEGENIKIGGSNVYCETMKTLEFGHALLDYQGKIMSLYFQQLYQLRPICIHDHGIAHSIKECLNTINIEVQQKAIQAMLPFNTSIFFEKIQRTCKKF